MRRGDCPSDTVLEVVLKPTMVVRAPGKPPSQKVGGNMAGKEGKAYKKTNRDRKKKSIVILTPTTVKRATKKGAKVRKV